MKPGSAIINTTPPIIPTSPQPILLAYANARGAIQNFYGGAPHPLLAGRAFPCQCWWRRPDLDAFEPSTCRKRL